MASYRDFRVFLASVWESDFANIHVRLLLCSLVARLLPEGRARRWRTRLIRGIGLRIGSGTQFEGMPTIQSTPPRWLGAKLRIGADCQFGSRVVLEFGDSLTIGDRVRIADGVVILTTTHQLGNRACRAGATVRKPVEIGNDVQIGPDAIILPGVRIGDAAHVLPNSVVSSNIGARVTVHGIPARPVRS